MNKLVSKVHKSVYGIALFTFNHNPLLVVGHPNITSQENFLNGKLFRRLLDKFYNKIHPTSGTRSVSGHSWNHLVTNDGKKPWIKIIDALNLLGVQNFSIIFKTNVRFDEVMSVFGDWVAQDLKPNHSEDGSNISMGSMREPFLKYLDSEYSSTFNEVYKSDTSKKWDTVLSDLTETCPLEYRNGKRVKVLEFWGEKLICAHYDKSKINRTILEVSENFTAEKWENQKIKFIEDIKTRSRPCVVTFLRIYRLPINDAKVDEEPGFATPDFIISKVMEAFPAEMRERLVGIFFGYGLYDLVLYFEADSYNEIQFIMNTLYNHFEFEKKPGAPEELSPYHPLSDSSTLISSPLGNESIKFSFKGVEYPALDLSIIVKVWAGYGKPDLWVELMKIGNALGLVSRRQNSTDTPMMLSPCVQGRQGFYDIIISIDSVEDSKNLKAFRDYCVILTCFLPFIQCSATIIRYHHTIPYAARE